MVIRDRVLPALVAFFALVGVSLAGSEWQIVKVGGREYLTVDNVARFYGLPSGVEPVEKRIRLDNGKNSLEVQLDSREILINGARIWLCFPVLEKDGQYLISRVDLSKTIEPQLRPQMIPNLGALKTVVLDPGHGGVDPGATGVDGTYEKDLVLSLGKALRDALERSGNYTVVMTRDTDIFLSLKARVAVGRRAKADLFVSLHADSAPDSVVKGASVYTLSEKASDREAEALARQENQSDIIAGVDLSHESDIVTSILIDLAQRETKNLSAQFAAMLVSELGRQTKLIRNTHRFAGFAVLKSPDVASVLVELGYLSNRADEKQLLSAPYRTKLAQAVVKAVHEYFDWQESLRRS